MDKDCIVTEADRAALTAANCSYLRRPFIEQPIVRNFTEFSKFLHQSTDYKIGWQFLFVSSFCRVHFHLKVPNKKLKKCF